MKFQIIALVALLHHVTPSVIPTIGVTVGLTPHSHPVISLYHSQDNHGQYVYGYSTPTSTKHETKTADGTTQGGYSYIDSYGHLQTVQYVADPVHGFRVAATNLPQDLPDVAIAKAEHFAKVAQIQADHAQIAAERRVPYSNPVAVPINAVPVLPQPVQDLPEVVAARNRHLAILQQAYQSAVPPQPVQDLPEVVKARAEHLAIVELTKARNAAAATNLSPVPLDDGGVVVPISVPVAQGLVQTAKASVSYQPVGWGGSSQYHAQDGLGQYSYGYVGDLSAKSETKSADGVTRGGYSYIDANGILQTVNYVSDPVHGFRVAATNLPVAPLAPTLEEPVGVAPVEVAAKNVRSNVLYSHQVYY